MRTTSEIKKVIPATVSIVAIKIIINKYNIIYPFKISHNINMLTQKKISVFKIKKRSLIIVCAIILAITCALMTIAAFYDYQIDYILAKPALPKPGDGFVYTNDVVARIVEIIGTGPCILATVAALVVFHQNAYRIPSKSLRLTTQIGSIAVAAM
jgi:hypothetical protein